MKLNKIKQDAILEQVLAAKAQAEGSHATILDKWNESYLYATSQKPGRTQADIDANITGISATVVVPVTEIAVNNAVPFLRDSLISKGKVCFSYRDRGFRGDPQVNSLIESNINKILLRDNDFRTLIENAIKDGCIGGDVFIKVYTETKTYTNTDEIEEWEIFKDYQSKLQNSWFVDVPADFNTKKRGSVKGFEWKTVKENIFDPMSGSEQEQENRYIRGSIPLMMIDEKIKVNQSELKDLRFDTSNGDDFSKCRYVCHSYTTTVGEAELRGYDPEILKRAADKEEENELPSLYFNSRYKGMDEDPEFESTDPKERKIKIDEHYIHSSQLHRKGETRVYQIITAGDEFLECNEILEFPFVHGQTETVLGSFWGRSFYDKAKNIQDVKTAQLRMILNNAEQTIHPRFLAVKGMYNRESLLQATRPGAVIEQNAAESIQQFPFQALSPEFYQAWQLVQGIEDQLLLKGFSSQDLKDISPLSTVTVAMGIAEDAKKSGAVAACLGRTLIKPIADKVYKLMKLLNWPIEDENGQVVAGFEYPEVYDIDPEVHTSGDDAAQVMQMQSIAMFEAQMSQVNSPVITPQNRHEMYKFMYSKANIDFNKFITDPSQNVDQHAAAEAARAAFVESEIHSGKLVGVQLENELKGLEIAKGVAELEELIKNGEVKRAIDQVDAETRARHVVAQAQSKVVDGINKAQAISVDDKRNNLDFVLGTVKQHSEHINRVNGVM
ncbi:hypothetical protein IGV50_004410 [Salmonella enterica subsp. enterica serovar Newport]|nr:hypothetical protein [Salmonella enterica subsp. enterica serovar Newport]